MATEKRAFQYDLALSFAGENRATVNEFAAALDALGIRVFYDDYEKADLWGKDLYQHLQTVYRDRARYCIIFVSEAYARKLWTKHELQQAQARAFRESSEYILPVRLDDTNIPGLNATTGYIDLRHTSLEELTELVTEKLFGREAHPDDVRELTWRGELVDFRGEKVADFWPEKLARSQVITHYQAHIARIPYGREPGFPPEVNQPCHDCFAAIGEYHVPGCDAERCPVCGGQAMGCPCIEGDSTGPDDTPNGYA